MSSASAASGVPANRAAGCSAEAFAASTGAEPFAVAKALGRSAGAGANWMAGLAETGQLKRVQERPKRYATK
jgi:hypothetical protein